MTVRVEALSGAGLAAALPALAALRIEVFRDWPYLYDGTLAYEEAYLKAYAGTPGAVMAAAFDGAEIVGVATAAPLASQHAEFVAPFEARGIDPKTVFYFGESCLRSAYRGGGIGVRFFEIREAAARAQGAALASFCAVVRTADHPARPAGYVPLDAFWGRRGYAKVEGMTGTFRWKETGDQGESDHTMQFWAKRLA